MKMKSYTCTLSYVCASYAYLINYETTAFKSILNLSNVHSDANLIFQANQFALKYVNLTTQILSLFKHRYI